MKAGRSGGGPKAPAGADAHGDWEQQVDYPVPAAAGGNEEKKVSQASREDRIRMKAYERAMQRGFAGGDEVVDWLEAEREVTEEERQEEGGDRR